MKTPAKKISERTEKERIAKPLDMKAFRKEIRKSLKDAARAGHIRKVF